MNKEKIVTVLNKTVQSITPFLLKIKDFVLKHKIITAVVSVVLVLVIGVTAFVFDKLNRINYDDGTNLVPVYTEPTQPTTAPYTTKKTKYTSYKSGDGSTIFVDGSYINKAGAAILSDGTTIYPTGIVVFPDGSFIMGSGIKVSPEGIATFSNGSQLHMTVFSIMKDGRITTKTPDGTINIVNNVAENAVINSSQGSTQLNQATTSPNFIQNNPGYNNEYEEPVYDTDIDEDFDDILQNIHNSGNSDIADELEENDQAIEQNRNNNEIWYSDDVVNILLLGLDEGGRNYPYRRSDAMIVASINKRTKDIKLVSFSRTAYVAIDGYANTRLNHAHGYGGAPLAIDTIEKNYKIRIDNYISTTFEAFQQLIDCLGGVDIGLTQAEINDDTMRYVLKLQGYTDLVPGTYTLNGYSALNYVRLRSIDSDRERTQRQRNVLTSLAAKAKSMNILQLNNALNEILPLVTTDLTKTEILAQAINVPSYLSGNIEQYVLPHKSSALQVIDDFEVVLVDWPDEIAYTHEVFYSGMDVKYVTG
ncbi:MAG: LytR family transcriptional regulator [Ruminococcaceae bacterium]|nr:LytR family transcriptional regulator [Oscillospiraceae bacterium]